MPKQAAVQPTPSEAPFDLRAAIAKIESEIQFHLDAAQQLIAALDQFDGESDLEDCGDNEPSLGSHESRDGGTSWAQFGCGFDNFDTEIDGGDMPEVDHDDEANGQPVSLADRPHFVGDVVRLNSARRTQVYLGAASPIFPDRLRKSR